VGGGCWGRGSVEGDCWGRESVEGGCWDEGQLEEAAAWLLVVEDEVF
jgi:hypothetical protein